MISHSLYHFFLFHVFSCFVFPPPLLPPSILKVFSSTVIHVIFYREKRGSRQQPFVTVRYLNCFHGFPFRSIHTVGVLLPSFSISLSLSVAPFRFTSLNYPKGCFDADLSATRASLPFFFLHLLLLLCSPPLSLSHSFVLLHILRAVGLDFVVGLLETQLELPHPVTLSS